MVDTIQPEPPMDGRSLRSVRTRRAVVEAFIDLLNDGVEQPTSQQVADRSGVSPSTIFRLFEDLDGMYAEALSVQTERIAHLLVDLSDAGTLAERIGELVRVRARLYEEVTPVLRFQARSVATFTGAASNRAVGNAYFRDEVAAVFARELAEAPAGTL
ncbi:MAG: TetR/AcrR family transcriptional regulator, partial [Microthrixaceae bacterium]